ncbi:MAG TPA: nuclear transport factor 2 family protein, partial [Candidatus Acidoferrum sp.]
MATIAFTMLLGALFGGCGRGAAKQDSGTSADTQRAIASLRDAYAAFNRGDMDAAVVAMAPDIDWSEPAEFPGGGAYHGREAVKGYLTASRANWAEGASEPEKFIVAGDRIVVFVHARVRVKGSAQWNEVRL